ncbi:MAG: hypothetical protein ABSH29_26080 [Acidimicrobiales bacterium]|jgi:hypothetical protein
MYYGDPDGNQMEFQVDCFAENDEANAFMYRSFSSGRASPRPGGESDRLSPALIDITSTPDVEELPYTSVSRAEQPREDRAGGVACAATAKSMADRLRAGTSVRP